MYSNETVDAATAWHGAEQRFAGLAGDLSGDNDQRPPLVLLHGLTFDRRMWGPALEELAKVEPGRRVLALDLPGHGGSPSLPAHDIESVGSAVRQAVDAARLTSPVVVGHSLAAVVATLYAARHPTSGVVNVDQPLQVAPFAHFVRSLAGRLRGPEFPTVWQMFFASMHVELLPSSAQELVRSMSNPDQQLVLSYWKDVLEMPVAELAEGTAAGLSGVRAAGVPYLIVSGDDVEAAYRRWVEELLPQATITVWPGSSHFPHLAQPDRFAECLHTTAKWRASPAKP